MIHLLRSFAYLLGAVLGLGAAASVFGQAVEVPGAAKVDGFVVHKLYDVPEAQGSWVSMTIDPKGRLIASDQYGGLYRIILGIDGAVRVEPIEVKTGRAHGLLYAFDALYVMSHAGDGQPAGLYRVRDTDDDDQFDTLELLRAIDGGGEHGPHAIVLSPDQKSLYVCAGNHTKLPEIARSRVPKNWDEDQIVERMWDSNGHAAGILAPGGWICKVDPDGKEFELISMGYRNEYDIAFDPNGELFTYDADMEWDIGLPWYRPTRVCEATPGSEFGWRSGTGKWPDYWPDSLPPVTNIGPGSPTGIVFGTGAKFPAMYQRALFIADWSYGVIYAVHMRAQGAGKIGMGQTFVTAPGMAVTDMVVNPHDGALYYLIGGRRTQSALYRVSYTGDESTEPTGFPKPTELEQLRHRLEGLLEKGPGDASEVVPVALEQLNHPDRFIRYAARVALERMPMEQWAAKVLEPKDAQFALEGIMALARCGDDAMAEQAMKLLIGLSWSELSLDQKIHWLRDAALLVIRHPKLKDPYRDAISGIAMMELPSSQNMLNLEITRLLCGIDAKGIVPIAMNLMRESDSQEEQIHYAFCLRVATQDWTDGLRREYFQWFVDAGKYRGGNSFAKFLTNTRESAVAQLSDETKKMLGDLLTMAPASVAPDIDLEQRKVVKKWSMEDWTTLEDADADSRNLENGRKMFAVGQCYKCHRLAGEGGSVGPDLTAAGRRFKIHDLLETLIVPSKEVSDQYQATIFQLEDGRTISGRIANLSGDRYMVQTDMLDPGNFTNISVKQIEAMKPSTVSMMPTGLLDSMNRDDVLDLLAYLRSISGTAMGQGGPHGH